MPARFRRAGRSATLVAPETVVAGLSLITLSAIGSAGVPADVLATVAASDPPFEAGFRKGFSDLTRLERLRSGVYGAALGAIGAITLLAILFHDYT